MRLQRGVDATQALQGAKHKIFVEGSHDEEIDPIVISELLKRNGLPQIEVRPMGGCDNVRSAAQALIRHHPSYYFLIDRDDQDQGIVESSWANFPNPETHNMLIWRKRELENYFVDPNYIENSSYLKITSEELREKILSECNRRIFIDAANLTLQKLHRESQKSFPEAFRRIDLFSTKQNGLDQLINLHALAEKCRTTADICSAVSIESIYSDFVAELSGNVFPLQYGHGSWLERMSGKEIFRCIAGLCFRVTTTDGQTLQGKPQNKEIARQLLALPIVQQPADFQQLFELLKARTT